MVVGLGFGDEGKGSIVDYLVRTEKAHTVVRFNGGPQAAHNVVTPDSKHHTFSQWGSGTLAGANTYLSSHVLINPIHMVPEAQQLKQLGISDPWSMLRVHEACKVITPFHIKANWSDETNLEHGSCGQGIGNLIQDYVNGGPMLYFSSLKNRDLTRNTLKEIADYKGVPIDNHEIDVIADVYYIVSKLADSRDYYDRTGTIVFEGAQGVLLDEWFGFHPHTTWSTCTFENALSMIQSGDEVTKIGVTRGYMTRHGNGPLPTEHVDNPNLPNEHNTRNKYQGDFRVGDFDTVLLKYAIEVAKPDYLAVTCLDHTHLTNLVCEYYAELDHLELPRDNIEQMQLTKQITDVIPVLVPVHILDYVKNTFKPPVMIESYGPTYMHKKAAALAL